MAGQQIRCVVMVSQPLLLEGLRFVLRDEFDVHAADLSELSNNAPSDLRPAIAIVDLPGEDARSEARRLLCQVHPDIALIYLVDGNDDGSATVYNKARPVSELLAKCHEQARRCRQDVPQHAARTRRVDGIAVDALPALSPRERQVLQLLVRGLSMKQVARMLSIAPRTVAFHKYRAMEANQLKNNAELISFVLRHGLLSPNEPAPAAPVASVATKEARPLTWKGVDAAVGKRPLQLDPIRYLHPAAAVQDHIIGGSAASTRKRW